LLLSILLFYAKLVLITNEIGSREAAFFYAIYSAGLVFSLSLACSQGKISSCGCDPTKRGKDLVKSHGPRSQKATAAFVVSSANNAAPGWKWGGCSADVRNGAAIGINIAQS